MPELFRSPLDAIHIELGAKMVPFGGWSMPLSYPDGTIAEHRRCRQDAVAFDVSHLGTLRLSGKNSFDLLQRTLTNDLSRIAPGRAQYTHFLDEDGSVLDDLIVWWVSEDRFDVMPNASNTTRVRGALGGQDVTHERAIIAIQGPNARQRLSSISKEIENIARFCICEFEWENVRCVAAGTGYTGEDGVECAIPSEVASSFWRAVLETGVKPAGLGARDTLRLEAGLPLHGHELGPGITPLQAGLGWVVSWEKGDFIGRDALMEERRAGPRRRLRGLVTDGRQPPREGSLVSGFADWKGTVTSGNYSPMLERGIAIALCDSVEEPVNGTEVTIDVRGRHLSAQLVELPFWPQRENSSA